MPASSPSGLNEILESAYEAQTAAVRNALEVIATAAQSTLHEEVERLGSELRRMEFKRGLLAQELARRDAPKA